MTPPEAALYAAFGLAVGVYGTLVGAGGGFLVVPFLLLLRGFAPERAVGTSLVVVCLNALAGSLSYARQRRIDYASGVWFAAATLPGALLGAYGVHFLPGRVFDLVFGVLLVGVGVFLFARPRPPAAAATGRAGPRGWLPVARRHTDASGGVFEYGYDRALGLGLSFAVGFLSSILGVGGGIVHVPALIYLLSFPVHVSTATSHFILAITAAAGAAGHGLLGHVAWGPALAMGAGAAAGAPLGALLSRRAGGAGIVRGLSLALFLVGLRLLFR